MIRHKRQPNVDRTLIQKVIDERGNSSVNLHPAETKMLKRNQQIRKRYAEKAQQLRQKAQFLPDKAQQIKYEKAAGLLEQHAKAMPVEATRGKKLHQQLEQKCSGFLQGLPFQFEAVESLNQYYAVTQGQINAHGVYISSAEELAKSVSFRLQEVSPLVVPQKRDIELDMDD